MKDQAFTDLIEDILALMPGFMVLSSAPGCVTVRDNTGDDHLIEVCAAVEEPDYDAAYYAAMEKIDADVELQKWQDDDEFAQLEDTTYDGHGVTLGGMANDS